MLVLLSDGSGLTARQCATLLDRAGHQVEALSPPGLALSRMTRHVRRVHPVPPVGRDPFGWLEAALDVAARQRADLLLPTQEQVAVLALARDRLAAAGLGTGVPEFGALAQVQDKVSAYRTLARTGLAQPTAVVAATPAELAAAGEPPVFVKMPIGTASAGVRRAGTREDLRRMAADYERRGDFPAGGLLVQQPVSGPLIMVQAVFGRGELVAFHACERVREGASGGASHKRGLQLPEASEQLARLGAELDWHGALSADVILGPDGVRFIDLNPRLVEPVNAMRSGVDLVRALIEVAQAGTSGSQPPGRPGVRTHQLLIGVLGAAQHGRRRDVVRELRDAALHRGDYAGSREELTPWQGDPLAGLPAAAAALATLARPSAWQFFTRGSASAYSLTARAWEELTAAAASAAG